MILDALERIVKHYDFIVMQHIMRSGAKAILRNPIGLKDFFKDIIQHQILDALVIRKAEDNIAYSLDDLIVDNDKACLLFSLINGKEADLTIKDMIQRRRVREATKQRGEGNSYSAHLAINLTPIRTNTFAMAYESVPRLPISVVISLLRQAVKLLVEQEAQSVSYTDQDSGKLYRRQYTFEAQGHPSESLKKMLQHGQINSLQVVNIEDEEKYWDDDDLIREKRNNVDFKINRGEINKSFASRWRALSSFGKTTKDKGYDLIRVGYRDDDGGSSTLNVDPDTLDLIDQKKLIKETTLTNFNNRLPTSFDKINTEIKDKMFVLI